MQTLKINGTEKSFSEGQLPTTVAQLLEMLDIKAATVAVELEEQIVERDKFAQTKLTNGQSIELIRFVGGG